MPSWIVEQRLAPKRMARKPAKNVKSKSRSCLTRHVCGGKRWAAKQRERMPPSKSPKSKSLPAGQQSAVLSAWRMLLEDTAEVCLEQPAPAPAHSAHRRCKKPKVSHTPPGLQTSAPPPALAACSRCTRVMSAPRRALTRVGAMVTGGVSPLPLPAAPGGSEAGRDLEPGPRSEQLA